MSDQKSEIDRDEVRKVIKVLKENLKEFDQGTGTAFELQQKGQITVRELGAYPAGQALGASTTAAYSEVYSQYRQFIASYGGLIEALEKMVGNHDDKEQENAAAANRVTNVMMSGDGGNPGRRNTDRFA